MIAWTGVSIFLKSLRKQLGLLDFFGVICLLHLGKQRLQHTKFDNPQLEYASPIVHPNVKTQAQYEERDQRTAAKWTCRRWRNASSVGDNLGELEWPSLESQRDSPL